MSLNTADFSSFLEEDSLIPHDITFTIQEEENGVETIFKAHRQFLAVVSPVFQKTFYGSFGNPVDPMPIKDSTSNAFSMLLKYIYKGVDSLEIFNQTRMCDSSTVEVLIQLLKLADRFLIDPLLSLCETALIKGVHITSDNLYDISRYCKEYSCFERVTQSLLTKCAKFLKTEVSRNFGILAKFKKDDFDLFQSLVELGDDGTNGTSTNSPDEPGGIDEGEQTSRNNEENIREEIAIPEEDMDWGWAGIFPLEETNFGEEVMQELSLESTARQKAVITCRTRLSPNIKELTCFSAYDRYSNIARSGVNLTVGEVFEKYMLRNSEPFLFYCSVPPFSRQLFAGTDHSSGFLNIEWADFVHIILLKGSLSCIVCQNMVRMEVGDVLRFDTINMSGVWNPYVRQAELLIVAHE